MLPFGTPVTKASKMRFLGITNAALGNLECQKFFPLKLRGAYDGNIQKNFRVKFLMTCKPEVN